MSYVDGFVFVVPRRNLAAYKKMAKAACAVWMELGALEYRECIGDDLDVKFGLPFPKLCKLKPGEVAAFSWILYRSRAHRDLVNKKVMKDPRITNMMNGKKMPFDMKRMACGGFSVIVES
jgi:uncharacterized protein YbaA (DUF1428 family)